MRLLLKSAAALLLTFTLAFIINACNSAEQTTAMIAYNQGDYKKAEKEFVLETKNNPLNEQAWFYLALSRAKLSDLKGCEEAMIQYKKIGKNTFQSELANEWGKVFDNGYTKFVNASKIKDTTAIPGYKDAIKSFEIALVLEPDSIIAQKNIEIIHNKINTIAVKPIIDKGVTLEDKGDFEGALAEYERALDYAGSKGANHDVVIYDIAICYLKWGEKVRDSVQTTDPENKIYKEQYKKALPYLEELIQSKDNKTQLQAYDLIIQVYGNLGMNDKAMEAIKIRDQLKGEQNENK
jgi:tetratricopeptide (TPR) repeat protein